MTFAPVALPKLRNKPAWDVPKVRACLLCKAAFDSEWSGQRICPHCKRSSTWQRGY